jgi:hypothetical protein
MDNFRMSHHFYDVTGNRKFSEFEVVNE